MTSSTGSGFLAYRFPARILASAVLAIIIGLAAPAASHAQEDDAPAWSLKRLFTSRKVEPPAEAAPAPEAAPPAAARKKARVTREPIDPQSTVVTKRPDAAVVMVVGDFMGSGLAEGLVTAYVDNPNVNVIDRTNGSSGFVRDDFYDWPARIGELIDAEKPAAVVIMLGANDRQQMNIDGSREAVRSEAWVKAYAARTQALAKAIADRKVPFIWVGVPSFKSSKMLLDMLAFNEIFKAAATGAGAEYVDIWDGFVDEDGAYVANGPDLNGQPARLRAADGINLARPGKRKLAFYAEKPLGKLLGDAVATPQPADPLADRRNDTTPFGPMIAPLAEEAEVVIGPSDLGPIDPGRPISLRSPALDGGAELLGLVAEPRLDARTPGEKLTIEGIAAAAPAGRADDFSWNPQGQTEFAAAIAPARPTTGKTPPPVQLSALAGTATPAAPPATLETPELAMPPLPLVPGELPEASMPVTGERPPVTELAPEAPPQEDLTATAKGRVTLEPEAGAIDRSPNRASPTAAPELAPSSGPMAEGAPTILPEPEIEVAPVVIEIPVAALPAPSVVAALPVTVPSGARSNAPNAPQKLARDRAPRPAQAPEAVAPPTSSGPAALAAPAEPAALPEDRAEAKLRVGMALDVAGKAAARAGAPTAADDASTRIAAPGRAAPAAAEELPADTRPTGQGKRPSALVAEAGDAAPPQLAPSELLATATPQPSERLWAWPVEPDAVPAVAATPVALPAPTTLRSGSDMAALATPALATPPETPRPEPILVPATDISALLSVPADLVPAEPVVAPEPVVSAAPEAVAAPEANIAVAAPAAEPMEPAQPEEIAALQPETPGPAPAAPTVAPILAQPEIAVEPVVGRTAEPAAVAAPSVEPEAAAAPSVEPVPAPEADRTAVPATDFSALVSVPPDLLPTSPPEPAAESPQPTTAAEQPEALASLQQEAPEPERPAAPAAAAPVAPAPSASTSAPAPAPELASPVEVPAAVALAAAEPVPVPAPAVADTFIAPETDMAALTSVPPDLMPDLPDAAKPSAEPSVATEQAPAGPGATPGSVAAAATSPETEAQAEATEAGNTPADGEIAALQQEAPASGEAPAARQVVDDPTAQESVLPAATAPSIAAPEPATAPMLIPETDISALLSVPPDLLPETPATEPATPSRDVTAGDDKREPVAAGAKAEPVSAPAPAGAPEVAPEAKTQSEPVAAAPAAAKPGPAEPATMPGPDAAAAVPTETRARPEAAPVEDRPAEETIAALRPEAPAGLAAPDAALASAPTDDGDTSPVTIRPVQEPVVLPEIDISALASVPPDLLAAPARADPAPAEAAEAEAAESAVPIPAAPIERSGFPVFDSVDDIPAPRLDAAGTAPAAQ